MEPTLGSVGAPWARGSGAVLPASRGGCGLALGCLFLWCCSCCFKRGCDVVGNERAVGGKRAGRRPGHQGRLGCRAGRVTTAICAAAPVCCCCCRLCRSVPSCRNPHQGENSPPQLSCWRLLVLLVFLFFSFVFVTFSIHSLLQTFLLLLTPTGARSCFMVISAIRCSLEAKYEPPLLLR